MTTFDHVHICCTDLNAMIEFWKNAFGAEFVRLRKFGTADGAVLTLAGTQIFLKEIPEGPPARCFRLRCQSPGRACGRSQRHGGNPCPQVRRPSDQQSQRRLFLCFRARRPYLRAHAHGSRHLSIPNTVLPAPVQKLEKSKSGRIVMPGSRDRTMRRVSPFSPFLFLAQAPS